MPLSALPASGGTRAGGRQAPQALRVADARQGTARERQRKGPRLHYLSNVQFRMHGDRPVLLDVN
ncbi:hypothetical protein, partial [Streptomyces collinus]